jgi:hypothetical protein
MVEFQPSLEQQVARCSLAAPTQIQSMPCAAGAEIEIIGGNLTGCTLDEPRAFEGFEIPAGSVLHLIGTPGRLERFLLPAMMSPLPAFGMQLPSNAEVWLCRTDWAVDQVVVPYDAFVEIGSAKLTGTLDFDCGVFRMGSLFEDSRIAGETWTKGRTVFRENLDLPPSGRP